jgi:hypothetical protein
MGVMGVIVTHSSLVLEFVDIQFNSKEIYDSFNYRIIYLLNREKIELPTDWKLIFQVIYTNSNHVLVSRNKIGNYKNDKMKYVSIVIPIPLVSEVNWGVPIESHIYPKSHYDRLIKNFWILEVDYKNFKNRSDYINSSIEEAIKKSFTEGIIIDDLKLKLTDFSNVLVSPPPLS